MIGWHIVGLCCAAGSVLFAIMSFDRFHDDEPTILHDATAATLFFAFAFCELRAIGWL